MLTRLLKQAGAGTGAAAAVPAAPAAGGGRDPGGGWSLVAHSPRGGAGLRAGN